LKYLSIERTEDEINEAVRKASFSEMKKIESTKGLNLDIIKNVNFVRQGKAQSWREEFSEEDLELFNRYHGWLVSELGYDW